MSCCHHANVALASLSRTTFSINITSYKHVLPMLKVLIDFQSVTPNLSLGGEVFWAGQHRKSGIGYAARFNTDKMV